MSDILIPATGRGGAGSDECTSTKAELLKGYTGILSDTDDEPAEGTLELTGNATAGYVYSGKTFYNTDAKTKQTGTMTVNSLLSFSCAAYSGRRILAKWQNPKAATGKPYSGVIIRYSTSGYPGKTGGTQIYKGAGSNTASGGQSQTYLDMPALNTTYYLSCTPYVTTNQGDLLGDTLNTTIKTSAQINLTIKGTQNYTIPVGYTKMDIFCVGAGGSGAYDSKSRQGGGGGGGGYTKTVLNISVTAGQVLAVTVGAGIIYKRGGTSSVTRSGTVLCTAAGGNPGSNVDGGDPTKGYQGGNGGSGGADGSYYNDSPAYPGGTNGGNGGIISSAVYNGGKGQGSTTRAFGEASGTLYAGGGGGGAWSAGNASAGGAGGGGAGGYGSQKGANGGTNTGGGGGGDGSAKTGYSVGGSGIVLIRLK